MCCCVQPWESRLKSSCEDGVIRAEQLVGLMPMMVSAQGITVDKRPQLPGKIIQDCDGTPRFHPHEQVF